MTGAKPSLGASAPTEEAIREQLGRILASRFFANSSRLGRFLTFAAEHALNGNGERLKEYVVGVEVFDRKSPYDPRIDPIVRVEARRLRSKLKSYYVSAGRDDRLVIELPKGGYTPIFRVRTPVQPKVRRRATPASAETAIAVLPFANLTRQPDDDYFSDGLTEELIHRLTRLRNLRVVAWTSASQLRGRDEDLQGLRELLKVDVVLRGSVRRAAGSVRVTAQLIETASGAYLWSETYDRDMKDILTIQEGIARAIVATLQLTLASPPGETSLEESNPESFNLYLQGRFHWNKRTGQGLYKSIQCFQEAVALDPNSALAYAGLADAYSLLADYGHEPPSESMPKARTAAMKALELDPNCGEAYTSLAMIRSHFDWNWDEAGVLYRRAIEINPGYSTAHHWLAIDYLAMQGRFDEAAVEIRSAVRLDPLSLIIREGEAYLMMLRREYDEAMARFAQLLDLDSSYYKSYSSMARVHIQRGQYSDAIAMLEKARSLAGDLPNILGALGQAFALAGRTADARKCVVELTATSMRRYVPSGSLAVIYIGLGDHCKALDLLHTACDNRDLAVTAFKVHPIYDPLRGSSGFQALVRRIGLA
jgi:TolB-like protein/Flp pilus assembly protein TadD